MKMNLFLMHQLKIFAIICYKRFILRKAESSPFVSIRKNWIMPNVDVARSGPQTLWSAYILPSKMKKPSDLQIFSRIDKAMKKWQWILNIFVNTTVLVIFYNVYTSDDLRTDLSTHGFFLSMIWLPHDQLWPDIEGKVSLIRC